VERISALWKQWERMDELRSMYIPFQMNTSSLIGGSMNPEVRQCRRLVSEGYIDLLGTDAHGSRWRPPEYEAAAEWIGRNCGEETLRRMAVDNPVSILNGQLLQF
ncbi:CpsB/CapC family capsule biosynthesis tyrosine phosphatase, partial [Catenibacillus scindens]|uniref:CpsB/CapC family capsule biosynthesis tyrosine phosphatase n=1 Tax=Catenibacillus scindens TaxID=673271 RepID=UPI00320A9119